MSDEQGEGQGQEVPAALSVWDKLQLLLKSRKFWALVAAIVTAAGAQATGQISSWEAVQAIVAALAVYSAAIAVVDAGAELRGK